MKKKKILLIITGSIAAYKSLTLIRLIKNLNVTLRCVLTKSAEQFVTPLTVSSLLGDKVYTDLFSLDDEMEMGHIKLARDSDLIIVAPASASFISKVANGLADDLASTLLLAAKCPTLLFPAMNGNMLNNYFTKKNFNRLKKAGLHIYGTNDGQLACGDVSHGRMKEPEEILDISKKILVNEEKIFKGIDALVTAGPTQELIDPVRFISNNSSGKQGYAIATQLANMGANVCLVSGPTNLERPSNIKKFIKVKTADQMLYSCSQNIPKDLFIGVAAVADWKAKSYLKDKIKKTNTDLSFKLTKNVDIIKYISSKNNKPNIIVGFAAETKDLSKNAILKAKKKRCDLIIANDVSVESKVMGSDVNSVHIFNSSKCVGKYLNMDKSLLSKKILTDYIYPLVIKKKKISCTNMSTVSSKRIT